MKKLFTTLILFTTLNGFSQNFAPPGATWYYSTSSVFTDGFIKIAFDGDTTIQGVLAQRLKKNFSYYNWAANETTENVFGGYEYTYSDQDHVYQLIGDEFKVLYDFTVQVDDTISVYSSEYFDWDINPDCDSVGKAIVTNTGTELINGLELRWYEVVSLEGSTFYLNGRIVERIGNTGGYLFSQPSDCIFLQEGSINGFRCYEDDDFPQYKLISWECDFVTGIIENSEKQHFFSIYPNPVTDNVTIEVNTGVMVKRVSIFTMDGSIMLVKTINNNSLQIDVSDIKSGVYLLEVETEYGFKEGKLIIVGD